MVDRNLLCLKGIDQSGCMETLSSRPDSAAVAPLLVPQFPTQMETLFTRESWQRFWLSYFPAQGDAIAFAFEKLSANDASTADGVLDVSSLSVDRIDAISKSITTDSEGAQQTLSEIFRVTAAHRRNLHVMHAVKRGSSLVAVDEHRYMYQFFGGPALDAYLQFKLQNPQMKTMRLVLPNTLYNGRVRDELSGSPSNLHAYAAALQLSSGVGVFASEDDVVYRAYGKKLEDTHPTSLLPETLDQSVMAMVGFTDILIAVASLLSGRGGPSFLGRLRPQTSTLALSVVSTEPEMPEPVEPFEQVDSSPAERAALERALVADGIAEPTVFGVGEQSIYPKAQPQNRWSSTEVTTVNGSRVFVQEEVHVTDLPPDIQTMIHRIFEESNNSGLQHSVEVAFIAVQLKDGSTKVEGPFSSGRYDIILQWDIDDALGAALSSIEPAQVERVQFYHTHPYGIMAQSLSTTDAEVAVRLQAAISSMGVDAPVDMHASPMALMGKSTTTSSAESTPFTPTVLRLTVPSVAQSVRSEADVAVLVDPIYLTPAVAEIKEVLKQGERFEWNVRLQGLHHLLARVLGRTPQDLVVVEQGPGAEYDVPMLLASQSKEYVMREPNAQAATTLGNILGRRLKSDQYMILGPDMMDLTIEEAVGGKADIVYASHPFPLDSSGWQDVNQREMGPLGLLDYLGRDLKPGGFLVIQTDAATRDRQSYAGAMKLDGVPAGWRVVMIEPIYDALMPSVHFQAGDDFIILQRIPTLGQSIEAIASRRVVEMGNHNTMEAGLGRLQALHAQLAGALGMTPEEMTVVEVGPGYIFDAAGTLGPRSKEYVIKETYKNGNEFLAAQVEDVSGAAGHVRVISPQETTTPISADCVYCSSPNPPMDFAFRFRTEFLDQLGSDVRLGGFLVLQTEVEDYIPTVATLPPQWRLVHVGYLSEPVLPSSTFSATTHNNHLVVLQRVK